MKQSLLMTAVAVISALATNALANEQAKIGDAVISLTKPDSFCALERSKPADARLLSVVTGALGRTNRMVGIYALCQDLPRWRSGKQLLLTDMIQYQTVVALMGQKFPKPHGPLKRQICTQFRTNGQALLDQVSPDVEKRLATLSDGIEVNQQRVFGVVDAADQSCVVLILQKIKPEVGKTFTQLGSFTPVVVKSKVIFIYLFVRFDPKIGGGPSVERVKALADALVKANTEQ